LREYAAGSSLATKIVDKGYLAIGEAAFTLEPLWGRGVLDAVRSGFRAAAACIRHLAGDTEGLTQYRDAVIAEYQDSMRQLRQYYATERCWARAPFWSRRNPEP